jgi:hypothetical protein
VSANASDPAASAGSEGRANPHRGRFFSPAAIEAIQGTERQESKSPTFRGWLLGILVVLLTCASVPHIDYVIRHTKLSYSLFPYSPVFILTVLVISVTALLALFRTRLGLTRQDLILAFGMGLVVNAIPGAGLCSVWLADVTGSQYYARPENRWDEELTQRFPAGWTPHDPASAESSEPRPIEWFYAGRPPGREMPWRPWIVPFLTWSVPFLCLFSLMFGACLLVRRQWSERERLPFPLAQLPEELTSGLGEGSAKPFLRDRAAQWGIFLVLALHAWNGLADYVNAIPRVPLKPNLDGYLTEPPWSALVPLWPKIYPSVIGLTFLVSLEVSFSLWFFFLVMKLGQVLAVQAGLGSNGWYFFDLDGHKGMFVHQGVGALLAMVLLGVWMGRGEFLRSLKEALGLRPAQHTEEDFHPRVPWLLLLAGGVGSVVWLAAYGASPWYSIPAVILLVLLMTGFTRVFCEAGVFYTQLYVFPMHLVTLAATPSALGTSNYFLMGIWDRVMVADSFRVLTMPNILNVIHLASRTGLRRRAAVIGLALAILIAVPFGLGSLLYTGYSTPGGMRDTDWAFRWFPTGECNRLAGTMERMESWEKKKAQAEKEGLPIPTDEVPDVARRDRLTSGSASARRRCC